jgi:hypothetical protein
LSLLDDGANELRSLLNGYLHSAIKCIPYLVGLLLHKIWSSLSSSW